MCLKNEVGLSVNHKPKVNMFSDSDLGHKIQYFWTLIYLLPKALTLRILKKILGILSHTRKSILTGPWSVFSMLLNKLGWSSVLRPSQSYFLSRYSFSCVHLSLRHSYEQREICNFVFCWQNSLIVNSVRSEIVSAFALSCHQSLFRMKEGMH